VAAFGPKQTNPFGINSSGILSSFPFFADLDADTDPDIVVGDYPSGALYYFENAEVANTAPTSAAGSVVVLTDSSYAFSAGDFAFSDPDGHAFHQIQITQLESVGDLRFMGSPVVLFQTIPVDDIGQLTYTPVTGQGGAAYDSFKFKVGDCFTVSSNDYTMTIDVFGVGMEEAGDPPVTVSPNPATGQVRIDVGSIHSGRVVVIDARGQVVWDVPLTPHPVVDVSGWSAGVYRVLVHGTDIRMASSFVVQ
jgi:hypothetical protein